MEPGEIEIRMGWSLEAGEAEGIQKEIQHYGLGIRKGSRQVMREKQMSLGRVGRGTKHLAEELQEVREGIAWHSSLSPCTLLSLIGASFPAS